MKKFSFTSLPTGGIVGKVTLVKVKRYKTQKEHHSDKNKHLGDSTWGSYGFVLENAQRLPFHACKGSLNFWNAERQKS